MLQLLDVRLEGIDLLLIDGGELAPSLHLTAVATHRDAALGGLHGVGIEVPVVRHAAQVIPDAEALLKP